MYESKSVELNLKLGLGNRLDGNEEIKIKIKDTKSAQIQEVKNLIMIEILERLKLVLILMLKRKVFRLPK